MSEEQSAPSDEDRFFPEGTIRMFLTQFNDTWKMSIEHILYPDELNDARMGKDLLLRSTGRRLADALLSQEGKQEDKSEPATKFLLAMECLKYYGSEGAETWERESVRLDDKQRPFRSWLEVRAAAETQVLLLYHALMGKA